MPPPKPATAAIVDPKNADRPMTISSGSGICFQSVRSWFRVTLLVG